MLLYITHPFVWPLIRKIVCGLPIAKKKWGLFLHGEMVVEQELVLLLELECKRQHSKQGMQIGLLMVLLV